MPHEFARLSSGEILSIAKTKKKKQVGFMSRKLEVLKDFDQMGRAVIEKSFYNDQ